jgi:hypothetical protein
MAKGDPLLSEDLCHYMRVASDEAILASSDTNPRRDRLFFGRICRNLENLRDCWRKHEPKTQRINCESFVLSVYFTKDPKTLKPFLYCGLNNGDLQMWSISGQTHSKLRQMEVHSKGVKVVINFKHTTFYIFFKWLYLNLKSIFYIQFILYFFPVFRSRRLCYCYW